MLLIESTFFLRIYIRVAYIFTKMNRRRQQQDEHDHLPCLHPVEMWVCLVG